MTAMLEQLHGDSSLRARSGRAKTPRSSYFDSLVRDAWSRRLNIFGRRHDRGARRYGRDFLVLAIDPETVMPSRGVPELPG
jgi:hypothetical protein